LRLRLARRRFSLRVSVESVGGIISGLSHDAGDPPGVGAIEGAEG
jgi:hypothetical protein